MKQSVLTWWPLSLSMSGSTDMGFAVLLPFFLPYLLTELALRTSSSLVLLIGIVFSGHLPF